MREPGLVDEELKEAQLYHPHPVVDALIPHFVLRGLSAEELLKHAAWREAYFARYGRIPPSELERMNPEHRERVLAELSELVQAEFKVRASNPLDPTTEDAGAG